MSNERPYTDERKVLANIVTHTALPPFPRHELLTGLLDNIARIANARLATLDALSAPASGAAEQMRDKVVAILADAEPVERGSHQRGTEEIDWTRSVRVIIERIEAIPLPATPTGAGREVAALSKKERAFYEAARAWFATTRKHPMGVEWSVRERIDAERVMEAAYDAMLSPHRGAGGDEGKGGGA